MHICLNMQFGSAILHIWVNTQFVIRYFAYLGKYAFWQVPFCIFGKHAICHVSLLINSESKSRVFGIQVVPLRHNDVIK